jgi:uncharacterized membrane protein
MPATVFWPATLGLIVLAIGLWTYRGDIFDPASARDSRIRALGPVFIAAAIATFSGEHFSAVTDLARLVPKWFPVPIPTTYLVGVCLLAAGASLATKRATRWSSGLLALLFALFVLLIHLPNAIMRAGTRIFWIFPFREGTFAFGAFAIFVTAARPPWAQQSGRFSLIVRLWTAFVVVFYGVEHLLYPQFSPGVPSPRPTSAWVPLPLAVSYATGAILIALGVTALVKRVAVAGITLVGILMTVLTLVLYVPDLFLANGVQQEITAINFVADTLLFAGSMFTIASAVGNSRRA